MSGASREEQNGEERKVNEGTEGERTRRDRLEVVLSGRAKEARVNHDRATSVGVVLRAVRGINRTAVTGLVELGNVGFGRGRGNVLRMVRG